MIVLFNFLCKSIFIIVLSIIYFYVKQELRDFDFTSYLFIIAAYLSFICTPYITRKRLNKTVQDMPVYMVSFIYLLIEIIFAFCVSMLDNTYITAYVTVQSIITGIYLIILFGLLYINEQMDMSIQCQYVDTKYLKEIINTLKLLAQTTTDVNVINRLESLIDLLQASPSLSDDNLLELENSIIDRVKKLEDSIYNNGNKEQILTVCNYIQQMINKRNRELKLKQYK